eukprot:1161253-Pelagomonas_calceolata.AAC.3
MAHGTALRQPPKNITTSQISHGLQLDISEQPCVLSLCREVPRVWGQKVGKIPAKMESTGEATPGLPDQQRWLGAYREHS